MGDARVSGAPPQAPLGSERRRSEDLLNKGQKPLRSAYFAIMAKTGQSNETDKWG